jgi:prophage regulatory protein
MAQTTGLIRLKDLQKRIGLSKASIYQLIAQNLFPRPVKLTPSGRAVGWKTVDIDGWIQSREEA